jgi:hypothetical protein
LGRDLVVMANGEDVMTISSGCDRAVCGGVLESTAWI